MQIAVFSIRILSCALISELVNLTFIVIFLFVNLDAVKRFHRGLDPSRQGVASDRYRLKAFEAFDMVADLGPHFFDEGRREIFAQELGGHEGSRIQLQVNLVA